MDDKKIEVIQHESIIELPMSGYFYSRILKATQNMISKYSPEQLRQAMLQIEQQQITEDWVFDLETMIILCKDFESTARKKGLLEEKPVDQVLE
jgi:hypothetical protein